MTTQVRFVVAALALSVAALGRAEPVSPRSAPARISSSLVAVLDSDHNGRLSAQEIGAAPIILAALDTNADGMLSSEELRLNQSDRRHGRTSGGFSANVVLALDANLDGTIQSMEIANAVSSLKQLDVNHDGELTASELRPMIIARVDV
jgi:hypothetical protein